jgi:hypothetical protein
MDKDSRAQTDSRVESPAQEPLLKQVEAWLAGYHNSVNGRGWQNQPAIPADLLEAVAVRLRGARPSPPPAELEGVLTNAKVVELRESCHMTYNGGWHHSEDGMKAFHHGMDTVCNVLESWLEKSASPPPATPQEKA